MILIQEWNQMLFLACPIMKDLSNLMWSGLFVNELSMHDYSRWFSVGLCKCKPGFINHMTCYKFKCSHWWKFKKKIV